MEILRAEPSAAGSASAVRACRSALQSVRNKRKRCRIRPRGPGRRTGCARLGTTHRNRRRRTRSCFSLFQLSDCRDRELVGAREILVEDLVNAPHAVAGDSRNLCVRASRFGEPGHRGAAQVMKVEAGNSGRAASAQPIFPEPLFRPGRTACVRQDDGRAALGGIEDRAQALGDRNADAAPGLSRIQRRPCSSA